MIDLEAETFQDEPDPGCLVFLGRMVVHEMMIIVYQILPRLHVGRVPMERPQVLEVVDD